MCGRYSQTSDTEGLVAEFDLAPSLLKVQPRFNFAPGQGGPVALDVGEDRPALRIMRWGLVPSWARDEKIGFRMINARAETVGQKQVFKRLFKSRRCLVLADGFYEWSRSDRGKAKVPYRFTVQGGRPFALAGLWDSWTAGPGEGPLETYTIITTRANSLVGRVHERMPVILRKSDQPVWLDREAPEEKLGSLLEPYDSEAMKGYRVSARLNKAGRDDPSLILPQEEEPDEEPGLFD